MAELVLVGEHSQFMYKLLHDMLNSLGYQIERAGDGIELMAKAQEQMPDLIVMALELPKLNGVEACKALKADARTYGIPVILLTAHQDRSAKLHSIEAGADDYVTKPFDPEEFEVRVRMAIKRNQRLRFTNPITGLPGYNIIHKEYMRRLARKELFAAYFVDIDEFKPYNEYYGYDAGDTVIKMVAYLLNHVMKKFDYHESGFIGHLGGDDFVVVTPADNVGPFCSAVIEHFDKEVPHYYKKEDRDAGFIRLVDRQSVEHRYPIMTVSVAVTTNEIRVLKNPVHIDELLTEILRYIKGFEGSNYHKDRRTD